MASTFITQRQNVDEFPADEVNELEALVAGVTQTSQSTLLLKKRKKLREMDDALDSKKADYNDKMAAFSQRQHKFEHAQAKLRKQVADLAPFLQENDAKRGKALKRIKEEEALRREKEQELEAKQRELERLTREKRRLEGKLVRLRRYEDFLQRVVEDRTADSYSEIGDVVSRHRTLQRAFEELRQNVQTKEAAMDATRERMRTMTQEVQNTVLVQNSDIHKYQKRLERLRADWFKHDHSKEQSERQTKEKIREAGQVVMAIRNLHTRCVTSSLTRSKKQASSERKGATAEQLLPFLRQIQYRVEDLQSIVQAYAEQKDALHAAAAGQDGGEGAERGGGGRRRGDGGPDSLAGRQGSVKPIGITSSIVSDSTGRGPSTFRSSTRE